MKKYILVILLTIIASTGFAQSNYHHVVFLKNDSIIKGVIVELVPDKFLKIEAPDGSVLEYQMAEIEKLTKEEILGKSDFKAGYRAIVEVGHQNGIGSNRRNRAKLDFVYGYQIKPYLYLGLGTGFRYYYDHGGYWGPGATISLFPYLRTNLKNKSNITPYLSTALGYGTNNLDVFRGYFANRFGLFFNSTVGIEFPISNKSAMNIGIGYEMQKFNNHMYDNIASESLKAYGINLGISF